MRDDLQSVLFHESTILARLDELAGEIEHDYRGKDLTVIALLNGSLMFMADLLRRIPLPLKLGCIEVASYHGGTRTTGEVVVRSGTLPEIEGRHVLILDDILDSGLTLSAVRDRVMTAGRPASVRICVLLSKRRQREREVPVDYIGFQIADEFVVGYGLDYQERYRNLPLIGVLRPDLVGPG